MAAKLAPAYARSAVPEKRSGAGGQIAIQGLKTMAANGTAILQTPMSMLGIYPHIYKKLACDPVADLTPVTLGAVFDFGFAVGPAVPAPVKSLTDFSGLVQGQP